MKSYSSKVKDVIPAGLRIINAELIALKPTAITGTVAHTMKREYNLEGSGLTYPCMIHHTKHSILYQRHSLGRQYSLVSATEVSRPSCRSSELFANMILLRGCFDSWKVSTAQSNLRNKKPEKLLSKQFGNNGNLVIFACLIRGSHAPIIGLTKLPRQKSSRFLFAVVIPYTKVQSLVSQTSKYIIHQIYNTAISNLILSLFL